MVKEKKSMHPARTLSEVFRHVHQLSHRPRRDECSQLSRSIICVVWRRPALSNQYLIAHRPTGKLTDRSHRPRMKHFKPIGQGVERGGGGDEFSPAVELSDSRRVICSPVWTDRNRLDRKSPGQLFGDYWRRNSQRRQVMRSNWVSGLNQSSSSKTSRT